MFDTKEAERFEALWPANGAKNSVNLASWQHYHFLQPELLCSSINITPITIEALTYILLYETPTEPQQWSLR